MTQSKLDAALAYAAHGWSVLPLRPNAKMPDGDLAPHGVKDATTDAAIIRDWWTRNPNANLGVATGDAARLYVVDVDAPQGGHTKDGAASLAAAGVELPATLTAATPNGGRHYYFTNAEMLTKEQVKCCADVNGLLGVDVRASGGYIVAPPSEIDGKGYVFQGVGDFSAARLATLPKAFYQQPKAAAVNPAPSVVSARPLPMLGAADAAARARAYLATCDAAISGQGGHNATLHAAHAVVVGFALDDATALQLLESEYNPRCVPPWTQKELMHKIESARQNPQRPLGYLLTANAATATTTATTAQAAATGGAADSSAAAHSLTMTKGDRYSRRRLLRDFPDPIRPEELNPLALFKNGWLRKGGAALLISVSGAGKSVAVTQCCDCWTQGRECFGVAPVRPLKIAVYQAEDDDTEVADFRNNIREGLKQYCDWTEADIEAAERSIVYHDVTGLAGDSFVAYLREAQARDKADLIIINPLQSFAGCDISKNSEMSDFLRVKLNPILANPAAPCGVVVVHHTNKVPANANDRKAWLDPNSAAYAGAGAAELVNWARAVLVLRPHEAQGYYDLIAAKRGKRLGWKDADGNAAIVRTFAHSEGLMFWREPSAEEVAAADEKAKSGNRVAKSNGVTAEQREKVVEFCSRSVDGYGTETEFVERLNRYNVFAPTKARAIIKECVTQGELFKVKVDGKNAYAVLTPKQYALKMKQSKEKDGGETAASGSAEDSADDAELDVEAIVSQGNVGA
jgi:hypothetical protein